jgi:SSS family solute:Na+ symporter
MLIALDVFVFVAFIAAVVAVGIVMSRNETDSEGYFLAGRGLAWWLIGFSLIAANISTEQFVGMSGQAARHVGLAVASYEWMAAITLVFVAFLFLPAFLRAGIYTIPEFLEYRFSHHGRTIMSFLMMLTYVCVTIAAVIYSGAKTVDVIFQETRAGGVAQDVEVLGVPINVTTASWAIGILAAAYVVAGGLKACAWADLLQGSGLILGGAVILVLALKALGVAEPTAIGLAPEMAGAGALERFRAVSAAKLHMVLPATDQFVPWTALVLGLWIPNFYYWGLNQYIVQRTLGSRSLREGQKGVVFAAAMKLIVPFIVVFPGIIAFALFSGDMKADAASGDNCKTLALLEQHKGDPRASGIAFDFDADFAKLYPAVAEEIAVFNSRVAPKAQVQIPNPDIFAANRAILRNIELENSRSPDRPIVVQKQLTGYQYDSAFGLLIKKLVPPGLRGFVLAAIFGAVVSSLAAMLNAASTIFTMDLYREYLHKSASQGTLVVVGRVCVVLFTAIGCFISPLLDDPKFGGIFTYIQEFQGFISPGILGVFIFGLFVKRAPRPCATVGLVLSPVTYGCLKLAMPGIAFLDRIAISFFVVLVVLGFMTWARPLAEPVQLPEQSKIALASSRGAKWAGAAVVLATLALYAVFW